MTYTYAWMNVDTQEEYSSTTNTLSLDIFNEHAVGTFRCNVTNPAGTGSGTVTIELGGETLPPPVASVVIKSSCAVPPTVTARQSPPGLVLPGTSVDLVCEATAGDQPISFSWTDGSGVGVSPGDTDGTISVLISASDTYTCTATNNFGEDTATVAVEQAGRA